MRRRMEALLCVILLLAAAAHPAGAGPKGQDSDLGAARRLFEENLDAIRHKDRAAYLACYLDAGTLARTGPDGFQLGFKSLADQSSDTSWPDLFEASDLRLVPVEPGVVYGTYRFRVRYSEQEQSGLSERLFLKTPRGWRIAVTTAFTAPPGTPPPPVALVGATLIDGTGAAPIAGATVVIRAGKIECAGSKASCPVPEGMAVTDLSGLWIMPGIVDAHVHFSQTGWADGRPDAIDVRDRYPYEQVQAGLRAHPERWFRSYLCSGVTAVFDVGGYPWTWELRGRAESDTLAPHVVAAGPLLSTLDFWLNLPAERQFIHLAGNDAARAGVRYLASHGASAVKVWFIPVAERNPEEMDAAVLAAGEEARKSGIPLIVHATGLREAKSALQAGANLLVHSVWDQPVDDEFIRLARRNNVIYCPTLTVADGYRRMSDSALSGIAPEVDDPGGCVDAETLARLAETPEAGAGKVDSKTAERGASRNEERRRIMAANLKKVHEAGITVAMGTDAGNPLTLHGPSIYAEMEAMAAAGLSPMDVLVASTRGGARAMGRENDFGTAEAGKIADLLIVAADPTTTVANLRRVRYVVRAGVLRAQEELRAARK